MELTGRQFLVTGSSGGIGRAVAVLLSRLGAKVICSGRNLAKLEETGSLLHGGCHSLQPYDVSNLAGIHKWMQDLTQNHGLLHGVVHAAGVQITLPLRHLNAEKSQMLFNVNAGAAQELARGFIDRQVYAGENGSIVFISSIMGEVGAPCGAAYSMSKGALHGMTHALALELAPKRIRVNCVAPAFINTPMYSEMSKLWNEAQRRRVEELHPLGIGAPEDVANAVAFLLADTSRWITGTILVVDGGYTSQ